MGLLNTPPPAAETGRADMLSVADFARVARMLHAHAGIVLHEGKRTLAASRLAKLARQHADGHFGAYVDLIANDAALRAEAVEALTTNHTKFFREQHHFDHVAKVLRPHLLRQADDGHPVRCWSAGSSTGEEVYSLAMTLLGSDPGAARPLLEGDVALLASDINQTVLTTGAAGRYPADAFRGLNSRAFAPWVELGSDHAQIASAVRAMVRFRRLNLLHGWPMKAQFDAIFCRNTMIYFDGPTTERLQLRLAAQLVSGGYLYIGHSERLLGDAARLLRPVGQTIFQKVAS